MELLGYTISSKLPLINYDKQLIVNTINPHSYCVAKSDATFREALLGSDFLLPDGIGIVLAARILKKKRILKIAGYDLFVSLMKQLNESSGTAFFLGAAPNTLSLIKNRASKEYPNVKIECYSPPYKSFFNHIDNSEMFSEVNKVSPDVLFVGMTAPKQEKWVFENRDNLNARVICSIGAVFDFYAGTVKRPSKFWIGLGLEWLPRFLKEPRRLAKRNLISTPKFLFELVKAKFLKI
ncbi:WecB/TagA/CpsF family glycosyltransferase [Gramella jeungdoensis]|uniref:WecB/TagA/CpsF family glycosyltransferase n=1 Tax=Gramella jeungdoensis TaxID=708091 RepID=A0ABT0YZ69_9FLAO|nr:WecB/TagA/CpsF family glycosyltransferase [Gramella jeungdoensis]MCM8568760.1 WecB/TagA/CpsF family glycosyltransferase [Gramella jeungdoensis]